MRQEKPCANGVFQPPLRVISGFQNMRWLLCQAQARSVATPLLPRALLRPEREARLALDVHM